MAFGYLAVWMLIALVVLTWAARSTPHRGVDRERHRQRRLHSIENLARRLHQAGRAADAIDAALAAV